jgi:hypothetical protein
MKSLPVSFLLLLLFGVVVVPVPAWAAKTDIVVLLNGDRITGEVKELAYGQLKFSTDDMGTLYIEWTKIASLTTAQQLQVELADGRRVFGQAPEAGVKPAALSLRGAAPTGAAIVPLEVPMSEIVRVVTIGAGEWKDRLDAAVSLGYSFSQASDTQVFNFAGSVGSRDRRQHWNVALDAQLTSQDGGRASQRAALVGTRERFMADRYYRESALEFTRNQELGLDLRSLVSLSFGRYLIQDQGREWRAGVGLAASAEQGSDGNRRESLEAQFSSSARLFRFDSPQVNLIASLTLLPSLSDTGRLRGESSLKLRREMVKDLFFEFGFYDSYDNRPAEGAEKNDWSVVTSLGYTF